MVTFLINIVGEVSTFAGTVQSADITLPTKFARLRSMVIDPYDGAMYACKWGGPQICKILNGVHVGGNR